MPPTVFRGKLQIATPADEAIAEYRVSAGEAGASYPEPVLTCVDSLSGTYTRKARTLVFSFNGAEETIGLSDDAVARVEAKIAELAFLEEARNGCEVTGMPPQIVLKNAQGEDQYSADTCNQLGVTGISELLAEFAAVAGKSCD
jgi:hypothetical protein